MGVGYWPTQVARQVSMQAFADAFATLGYEVCEDGSFEVGVEKIAIFGTSDYTGDIVPTHAARQHAVGTWTSKLGSMEDISHQEAEAVCGPLYGNTIAYMSRNML